MNPDLPRSAAGNYNPWMIACMLSLAPFMEVLDTTIANVSLTHIAGSLGAGQSESTWILTSYLVSNSVTIPISGWLSQVIGRKRFFQICTGLFVASSVLCAFSTSLDMIIVARVLQGLGGGGLAPVAQGMLADSFVPEKRQQVFALFGFTVIVAPATGPVIGGWLTDTLTWHWIFLINLPIGLVAMTLTAIFVTEPALLIAERREMLRKGLHMDYFGLFLIAVGFGTLQIFLDKFVLDDGFSSTFIDALAAAFIVALSTLVVWEWGHPQPVMNVRLFKIRNFSICGIVMFFIGFIFLSSTQLLPQLAESLLGYDAQTAGLMMALGGMATICVMPVSAFITGRYAQPRFLLACGLIMMGAALVNELYLTPDVSFSQLSLARIFQVVGMPLIFVPLSASAFIGVPPRNNGDASAMMNQLRNIGGSMGISFTTALLAWRTQFHHARFAESITPYGSLHGLSVSQVAAIVQQQAGFVSYLDAFKVTGIIALVIWPIVLFLKPPAKRAA